MLLFLIPLLIGFIFTGASAFTTAYSRQFGERGGQMLTAVLRNVLGIPLLIAGFIWAWSIPSSWVFLPAPVITVLGWSLVLAGLVLVVVGHIFVGMRSHLPSVRDTLVRRGIYAWIRHPIYAGVLMMMPGVVLIRPSFTILVASALVLAWLFVQARLEEVDLVQRIPEYREYMRDVPRFFPRIDRRGIQ